MPECCVSGCISQNSPRLLKRLGNSYFPFPTNPRLLKKWLTVLEKKNWKPDTSSRVCSIHFFPDDYVMCEKSKTAQLNPDAIPYLINYLSGTKYPSKPDEPRDTQVLAYCGNGGSVVEIVGKNTLLAHPTENERKHRLIDIDLCIVEDVD